MKKIPKLRFPEFSGEWEEKRLGNVKDVRDGTHDSPKYKDEGHPLVTSKNLTESGLSLDNVSLISSEDFNEINKRSKVDTGDIIFGMIGTIGNPVLIDCDNFAIKNVALIKDGGYILNLFLLQHLKSPIFERYIQNEKAGNTQKFLGLNKIRDYVLLVPSLPEQHKIAGFLSTIDSQLETKEQEIENLEGMKKGFMQKIFSQEMRFKDEEGKEYPEWEEKRLGELFFLKTSSNKEINNDGTLILIDMGTISQDGKVLCHKRTVDNSEMLSKGDLVMPKDDIGKGLIICKTGYISEDDKFVLSDHVFSLRKRIEHIEPKFYHYLINSDKVNKSMRRNVTGSAQLGINQESVKMELLLQPSLLEQQKIANFLSLFDEKIEIEKEILETLKEIKKGLLQQMFV